MMNNIKEEKYNKYNHSDIDLEDVFYCLSLKDDYEGFRLILKNKSGTEVIKVAFEGHVAYQNTFADDRIRMFTRIKSDLPKASLYKVSNSKWINWFVEEAMETYSRKEIEHYVILTSEFIIDVLSMDSPQITVL